MKRVSEMTDDEVRDLCGSRDVPEDATRDAANRVAEAVRLLNYLSLPHDGAPGLTYPSDVYDGVAGLETAMQRMPQLLSQWSAWLEEECEAGRVGHATARDPGGAVADTIGWLGDAAHAAGEMEARLRHAHNELSPLKANT